MYRNFNRYVCIFVKLLKRDYKLKIIENDRNERTMALLIKLVVVITSVLVYEKL